MYNRYGRQVWTRGRGNNYCTDPVSVIGTYNWCVLERADSLCFPVSFGEPMCGTQEEEMEKKDGNVTAETKECGIFELGLRGRICALFSPFDASLGGAKCISRKIVTVRKNAF